MVQGLGDLTAHNVWATAQILNCCEILGDDALNATVPGTYGTVIQTLRHIIDSEASYLLRIAGAWEAPPWARGEPVGIAILKERATVLASTLEALAARGYDAERRCEARGDDGEVFAVPAGVIFAQLIHHANEHRAHICTILGSLGIEPPGVSAWDYSFETGRSTQTADPSLLVDNALNSAG